MSVSHYRVQILSIDDFSYCYEIPEFMQIIKAWRHEKITSKVCTICSSDIRFRFNFALCCRIFYYKPCDDYIVQSIAVRTENIHFMPAYLQQKMIKHNICINQQFLVFPDPIYWQLHATLTYEVVLKFISNKENFEKCKPRGKVKGSFHQKFPQANYKLQQFYKKLQTVPLYHCSLLHRTQGKETFYRKTAISKRAEKTARAMIVPAPHLRPNQIVLPIKMARDLHVIGKWVIVNRMPSLSPDSFVALFVAETWSHDCIGIPCEILSALNADFDGDEVNLWPVLGYESQCECEYIVNSEENMRSFINHLKLYPSQDMLVAYYLQGKKYMFEHLRVIYEMHGSKACFEEFDRWRKFYLHATENMYSFSISFVEFLKLAEFVKEGYYEIFEHNMKSIPHDEGCLEVQVKSKSKGTYFHLFQLVGSVGYQYLKYSNHSEDRNIKSSFLKGLTPNEYVIHAKAGYDALIDSMIGVWQPGYNYFKLSNNMQNIVVDYAGRIVDGDQVICSDALEQIYFEDLISPETFTEIYNESFQ